MRSHGTNSIATNFINGALPFIFTLLELNRFHPFKRTSSTSACDSLSRNRGISCCSRISESRCHDFCIRATDIRHVSSFFGLLQLACENGDCYSSQDGSERIVCELLIPLRLPSPTRKSLSSTSAYIMRNGGFLTIAQKWYGLRKNGYHCAEIFWGEDRENR